MARLELGLVLGFFLHVAFLGSGVHQWIVLGLMLGLVLGLKKGLVLGLVLG
jgi:hypothetical protein